RGPDRDPQRTDQLFDGALQGPRQGPSFASRTHDAGRTAPPAARLPEDQGREAVSRDRRQAGPSQVRAVAADRPGPHLKQNQARERESREPNRAPGLRSRSPSLGGSSKGRPRAEREKEEI